MQGKKYHSKAVLNQWLLSYLKILKWPSDDPSEQRCYKIPITQTYWFLGLTFRFIIAYIIREFRILHSNPE